MFFKDFVSVKRQKIKRGASQTYDTPSFCFLSHAARYSERSSDSGQNADDQILKFS